MEPGEDVHTVRPEVAEPTLLEDRMPESALPDGDELDDKRIAGMLSARQLVPVFIAIAVLIVAIYVLLPKVAGVQDAFQRIDNATWYWIVIALAFNGAAFAAYVALFRGVLGGRFPDEVRERLDARASYEITMASLAATRLVSAAGAGGLVLTYWALRKAGMPRRRAACRMVALLVLLYTVYLVCLIVFGVLLREGVLPGDAPFGGTIIPAIVAGVILVLVCLLALIPGDFERRLGNVTWARRVAAFPATVATGVRTAIDFVRSPRTGALAVGGALGFWAANIGILWASFEAFGGDVPFGVLVMGFFVGMAANLIPSPAAGAGPVDGGMIAAFLLFDVPNEVVLPAVLVYRVIAFWLPLPPGIVAYFQLRKRVERWQRERGGYPVTREALAQ